MAASPPARYATQQRATLRVFEKLETLRRTVIQRAHRLTRRQARLTLTITDGDAIKNRLLQTLTKLPAA